MTRIRPRTGRGAKCEFTARATRVNANGSRWVARRPRPNLPTPPEELRAPARPRARDVREPSNDLENGRPGDARSTGRTASSSVAASPDPGGATVAIPSSSRRATTSSHGRFPNPGCCGGASTARGREIRVSGPRRGIGRANPKIEQERPEVVGVTSSRGASRGAARARPAGRGRRRPAGRATPIRVMRSRRDEPSRHAGRRPFVGRSIRR